MLTQATVSMDYDHVWEHEHAPTGADGVSPSKLDQIYIGERDAGHPVMFVVGRDGIERTFAPALGGFDWGWPSMGGTRRLARALLLDLTSREPPAGLRDAFATEELAHFPWGGFRVTGEELLGWIESRGHTVTDWPVADASFARHIVTDWPVAGAS
jgi:hypothetical protein